MSTIAVDDSYTIEEGTELQIRRAYGDPFWHVFDQDVETIVERVITHPVHGTVLQLVGRDWQGELWARVQV